MCTEHDEAAKLAEQLSQAGSLEGVVRLLALTVTTRAHEALGITALEFAYTYTSPLARASLGTREFARLFIVAHRELTGCETGSRLLAELLPVMSVGTYSNALADLRAAGSLPESKAARAKANGGEHHAKQQPVMGSAAQELYPEGRTLFYEGDDPERFIRDMRERGLACTITVRVPAHLLNEIYHSGAYPLGS